jgi:hypothetical protein
MQAAIAGVLMLALAGGALSQTMDLKGRVVQANGLPVPEARVELKLRGVSAKTSADGGFAFSGSAALMPAGMGAPGYRLYPDHLDLEVSDPQEIRLDFLDVNGRIRGGMHRFLEAGRHRIDLSEGMPASGGNLGPGFLRVDYAGRTRIHPYSRWGRGRDAGGAVFAPELPSGIAAKRSAAVDTLRVFKAGFQDYVKPIANYAAGDLGDLVLVAGDGSVCAKQHADTAAGGAVVFCDALFDQDPRVHMPAATAGSAYAAITDGFVTMTGESYPLLTAAEMNPEMRRHASALYEIKISNGKVASYRPAVVFDESLFMAPLMGRAFEGLISKRLSTGRYEGLPSLPVRVQVSAERFPATINSASPFELKATIANLDASVTAADGTCLASLSSQGAQAPFDAGKEVLLPVGRVQSMHGFGDDELVFTVYAGGAWMGSLMARTWFFRPLDLVKGQPALADAYTGVGHGSPGTIPYLNLKAVTGGGAPCVPK